VVTTGKIYDLFTAGPDPVWTGARIRNIYGGGYDKGFYLELFTVGTVYWNWSGLSGCGFRITTVHLSEIKVGTEGLWVAKLSGMNKLYLKM
jgi:hypothetical protein